MAKKILLTGAGFSKAFNGYLCNELTAYFFNALAADEEFRTDILSLKPFDGRNFEMLLSELRGKYKRDSNKILKIEGVLKGIFQKMCDGMFCKLLPKDSIAWFFYEFDYIFTTNQDAIQNQNQVGNSWTKKFNIDPTKSGFGTNGGDGPFKAPRAVISDVQLGVERRPYFELHGAYDWQEAFILGDGILLEDKKITSIRNNPILSSYFDSFKKSLCEAESSLVIVGYGFLDQHINEAIVAGINVKNGLKIFIWDPNAETYLKGFKKNIERAVVPMPENSLESVGMDKSLLQKSLRGYLPKGFNLEGDDKEDVKKFLKASYNIPLHPRAGLGL